MKRSLLFPVMAMGVLTLATATVGEAEQSDCNNKMCRATGTTGEFGTVECAPQTNGPDTKCALNLTETECPVNANCAA